jgi:DNA-binding winged helix-turn-helix (wHTH) protein/tetratricopeptide (TPR) repeat protein
MPKTMLRFDQFELDPVRRILSRNGDSIHLRPMGISLLCHLVSERDRVVPKDELLETLWPDGSGTEANLTVTVAAVRKALGERVGAHRILITVPREGYRFVGELQDEAQPGGPNSLPRSIALLPIELIETGDNSTHSCIDDIEPRFAELIRRAIGQHAAALAGVNIVVPELTDLTDEDLDMIATRLGVDGLLVGTLEDGAASVHLELKILDREGRDCWHSRIVHTGAELQTLPLRAARHVVGVLNPDQGRRPRAHRLRANDNSPAWRAFLQARFHFASGDGFPGLHQSLISYQKALELAPDLAPAHAGLAEVLVLLRTAAMLEPTETASRIRTEAALALECDPLLPESHLAMAQVSMILDHNWLGAREHLLTALDFGPDNPWVHSRYAIYLSWRRQFEAALDAIHRAQSLDPFSMRLTAEVAKIHYFSGQPEVAFSILESATARKIDFTVGWINRAWFHLGTGDGDASLAALDEVRAQIESTSIWDVFTGAANGISGRAEQAQAALQSLQARRERGEFIPWQFDGMIQLSLGDFARATECIRLSAEERYGELGLVEADPFWAPIRSWPDYEPLRQRYFARDLSGH